MFYFHTKTSYSLCDHIYNLPLWFPSNASLSLSGKPKIKTYIFRFVVIGTSKLLLYVNCKFNLYKQAKFIRWIHLDELSGSYPSIQLHFPARQLAFGDPRHWALRTHAFPKETFSKKIKIKLWSPQNISVMVVWNWLVIKRIIKINLFLTMTM